MPLPTQSSPVYGFGNFEANPRSGELLKKGFRVRLQDKPFQLLVLLLQAQGDVVTKDELRNRLWPAGIFVELDGSLNAAVKKLRAALNDSADHPRFIETVPKVGYRFVAPVSLMLESAASGILGQRKQVETLVSLPKSQDPPSFQVPATEECTQLPAASKIVSAASVLLAVTVLGVAYYLHKSPSEGPIHSIVVLPFENLSGDQQRQYFADGMTDKLISDLAKLSSLSVISRTSAMQYRGTRKPLPLIGRELKVDPVVEGSVVVSGDKVRVTVQLINARNDRHLWAENYERETQDLVQLQSEIVEAIVD